MKVFLSWSGPISKHVAGALREWLPNVINEIVPFMSSEDIDKGRRGLEVIARELQETRFGIVIVTAENYERPWINYEAGALSKMIDTSHVTPLLVGVDPSEVVGPLAQFQHVLVHYDDVRRLMVSINGACDRPLPESRLRQVFDVWWPRLHGDLLEATKVPPSKTPYRDTPEILKEVLGEVRGLRRDLRDAEKARGSHYVGPTPVCWLEISYTGSEAVQQALFRDFMDGLGDRRGWIAMRSDEGGHTVYRVLNIPREGRKVLAQDLNEVLPNADEVTEWELHEVEERVGSGTSVSIP